MAAVDGQRGDGRHPNFQVMQFAQARESRTRRRRAKLSVYCQRRTLAGQRYFAQFTGNRYHHFKKHFCRTMQSKTHLKEAPNECVCYSQKQPISSVWGSVPVIQNWLHSSITFDPARERGEFLANDEAAPKRKPSPVSLCWRDARNKMKFAIVMPHVDGSLFGEWSLRTMAQTPIAPIGTSAKTWWFLCEGDAVIFWLIRRIY